MNMIDSLKITSKALFLVDSWQIECHQKNLCCFHSFIDPLSLWEKVSPYELTQCTLKFSKQGDSWRITNTSMRSFQTTFWMIEVSSGKVKAPPATYFQFQSLAEDLLHHVLEHSPQRRRGKREWFSSPSAVSEMGTGSQNTWMIAACLLNTVDSVKHGVDRTRVNDMTDSRKRTCQCLWREESTWVWQRRQAAILCWSCTWTPRERRTLSRCPPQWTVPRWWSKGCLRCWGRQWRSWPTCWRVSWRRGWWGRGGSCQRGQRSRWVPSKQLLQRMQHLCGQTNTLPWCYQSPAGMCSSCILQRARHRPCREESQPASDLTSAFLLSWIIPARQYSSAASRQQCTLCNLNNTHCTVLAGGEWSKNKRNAT